MNRRKRSKGQAGRILGTLWMPLVAVIVIAVVGFGVNRIREKSQAISHPPTTRPIPATVVQINP
ncbi:MmpS family transport accessory protein, partial [Mycobacteroides abscessus]